MTNPTPPLDLDAIMARAEKATPGPWVLNEPLSTWIDAPNVPKGPMHVADVRGWGYLTGKGHGALGLDQAEAMTIQRYNAEFICASRSDIPALCDEVKRLRKALQELHEVSSCDERDYAPGEYSTAWNEAMRNARALLEQKP